MKKTIRKTLAALLGGLLIGGLAAAHAKLPPPPAKTDVQKKAEADKAAAEKAKDAETLGKAQDRAVANYRKNRGGASMAPTKAQKK